MKSLNFALSAYLLAIVFSMLISLLIPAVGIAIKRLRLDREDEVDIAIPTSDSVKEEECVAVAIAVAHARANRK